MEDFAQKNLNILGGCDRVNAFYLNELVVTTTCNDWYFAMHSKSSHWITLNIEFRKAKGFANIPKPFIVFFITT